MTYDAFVSYSHAADGELSPRLQAGLQRFAKPWWKRRALVVFRDQTGLSANPGLWSSITAALDDAEWFVLLASPDAAKSEWVGREIDYWVEHKGTDHLLPIVTEGDWIWDPSTDDFAWDRCTAVPESLRGVFGEEPRHVDMTWARDESHLDLRNGRFRDQIAEIAAPIRGVTKDSLEGTDLREHRRTRRTVVGIGVLLAFLTIASVIAGIAANRSAHRANANELLANQRADDATFGRLVAQAHQFRTTDPSLAMLLAAEARNMRDNPDSWGALQSTVFADSLNNGTVSDPEMTSGFYDQCLVGEHTVVAAGYDGWIGVYDLDSRTRRGDRFRLDDRGIRAQVSCSRTEDSVVAYDRQGNWSPVDVTAAAMAEPVHHHPGLYRVAIAPDGASVALADDTGTVTMTDMAETGPPRSFPASASRVGLSYSPDGHSLATANQDGVDLWDTETLALRLHLDPPTSVSTATRTLTSVADDIGELSFSADGQLLAISTNGTLGVTEVTSGRQRWSVMTRWYGASAVTFTDDGRLWAQVGVGTVDERSVETGVVVGRSLSPPSTGSTLSSRGPLLVVLPQGTSALSVLRLDGAGPLSTPVVAPGMEVDTYDPVTAGSLVFRNTTGGSGGVFDTLQVLNTATGRLGPPLPAMAIAKPTADHEIAGLLESDLHIGFFDTRTGQPTREEVAVPTADANSAMFDARTHHLVIARNTGVVDLYDESGAPIATPFARPGGHPDFSSAFSGFTTDGWIAGEDDSTGHAFVLTATGDIAFTTSELLSVPALSRDGTLLAGMNQTGLLALYDGHTGQPLGITVAVPPATSQIEFSADGHRLMASDDLGAVLVDVASHLVIGQEFEATGGFVALRPDGQEFALNTGNGALLVDLDTDHWRDAACQLAGRNLTRDEWSRYLPDAGAYRPTCLQWQPAP